MKVCESENAVQVSENNLSFVFNGDASIIFESKDSSLCSEKILQKQFSRTSSVISATSANSRVPEGMLLSVTFCSSEKCNMCCKYCYAESGTYGNKKAGSFTLNEYRRSFDEILKVYPKGIASIIFFGGEPLLNISVIMDFVEYVDSSVTQKQIISPIYGIVTNGTLIDRKISDFLIRHHFIITISLDGDRETNDSMRMFRNKQESVYDTVCRSLSILGDYRHNLVAEATLTDSFFRKYTSGNVEKYLNGFYDLGFKSVSPFFAESGTEDLDDIDLINKIKLFYHDLVDCCFTWLIGGEKMSFVPGLVLSPIVLILTKMSKAGCTAGKSSLFVTKSGVVYPCQMYYSKQEKALGSIDDIKELHNNIRDNRPTTRFDLEACNSCFAKHQCALWCPGGALRFNGNENSLNPIRCLVQKSIIERVIYRLGVISKQEDIYKKFIKNVVALSKTSNFSSLFGSDSLC